MKTTTLAALMSSLVLIGCDGHSRRLYLSHQATRTGGDGAEVSVSLAKIEQVALSLGLNPAGDGVTEWTIRKEDGSAFSIVAVPASSGKWDLLLKDWPSFVRSDLSKEAERLLEADYQNEN
jgi:hypothetical protein